MVNFSVGSFLGMKSSKMACDECADCSDMYNYVLSQSCLVAALRGRYPRSSRLPLLRYTETVGGARKNAKLSRPYLAPVHLSESNFSAATGEVTAPADDTTTTPRIISHSAHTLPSSTVLSLPSLSNSGTNSVPTQPHTNAE